MKILQPFQVSRARSAQAHRETIEPFFMPGARKIISHLARPMEWLQAPTIFPSTCSVSAANATTPGLKGLSAKTCDDDAIPKSLHDKARAKQGT